MIEGRDTLSRNCRSDTRIAILALPLLLGCTEVTDIDIDEDDVFIPAFRASYQIIPEEAETLRDLVVSPSPAEAAATGPAPSPPSMQALAALDFGFGYGQGASSQDLAFGELVSFDDVDFRGPAHLRYIYELSVFSAAFRGGGRIPGVLDIEGFLGAGWTSLDLVAKSPYARAHDVVHDVGFLFGVKLTGHPFRWLDLYARGSELIAEGQDGLGDAELGFALKPVGGLSLFAGWRWWDYDEEVPADESDIELDISGPTCGVELLF